MAKSIDHLIADWQDIPFADVSADCIALCADYAGVAIPDHRILSEETVSEALGEPRPPWEPACVGDIVLSEGGLSIKLGYASAYLTMTADHGGLVRYAMRAEDVEAAWRVR